MTSLYSIRAYIPSCTVFHIPISLPTTLKKLESVRSEANRVILQNFSEYMYSKNLKSERHIVTMLTLLISFDRFLCKDGQDIPFTSINTKEQVLTFLDHQYVKIIGWVKREHDSEGKYITTFNQYLGLLRTFFRWLYNSYNKPTDEDWETPLFIKKIKAKRPLRDSPYGNSDIWQLDEVLTIVQYGSELRNQAIITLLWDL